MNSTKVKRKQRSGSALLVCTLAAAVLAMAGVAILRSSQRNIARVDALRSASQGRNISEGLYQRAIAVLRANRATGGTLVDPGAALPGARCELTPLSANATQVQVFLYPTAVTPSKDVIIDPTTL